MALLVGTSENNTFTLKSFGRDTISDPSATDHDLVKASFDQTLAPNVENLTLINNNVMLNVDFGGGDVVALARPADPSRAIVGSWQIDDASGRSVITFLPDGTYMHVQKGPTIGLGHTGFEVGTYQWNATSGAVTFGNITADTNGDWGFSDSAPTIAQVEGGTLTFSGDGTFQLARIEGSGSALVGSWYDWNAPEAEGIAIVTFFADGKYMFGQDGSSVLDPSGHDGMEYGTYTYDPMSGHVTYTATIDKNGQWGLSIPTAPGGSFTATVRGANGSGNGLANTLTGDGNANVLSGLGGNDILKGSGGADKLIGGAGADQLFGGTGKDLLNGGAGGADRFFFDVAATPGNADTIQGFEHGLDKIVLDASIFMAFNVSLVGPGRFVVGPAIDGNDNLIYDSAHGKLYYDADGGGVESAKVLIATLAGNPVLDAGDFKIVA